MSFEDAFLEIDISSWLNIFFNLYSRFNRLVFFYKYEHESKFWSSEAGL